MKIYLAPLQGNTGYIYRRTVHDLFGGFDKYFIPFINPNEHGKLNTREKKDVLPHHNEGMHAVPQILAKNAEEFVNTAHALQEDYGYHEINLNLGCPARTVVTKGRGSGLLAEPDAVERLLYGIFEKCTMKISIKTRLGMEESWEFEDLLGIYNRYPLEEVIIHPRVQKDYYDNQPNLDAFSEALQHSKNTVCYNGNIFSNTDYENIRERFPELNCIMIGRGVLADPSLARQLRGGKPAELSELWEFHDRLYNAYRAEIPGDKNVLFRMKELWSYLMPLFSDSKKYAKKIKKCERCAVYESIVAELFANGGAHYESL